MIFKNRKYSLKKSRQILKDAYQWFQKNSSTLSTEKKSEIETLLRKLDKAILEKNKAEASNFAHTVEGTLSDKLKKGVLYYAVEMCLALGFALIIAICVRQMWFEIYEIPTGSMRPTFKEKDHVTVSKTAFGLNIPLKTDHFYFDPDLVKRSGVVIFTSENLPLSDTDASFFGILPYKKRFIKRLIGKPGDTLYFYGGKIYGIDRDGNEIRDLIDSPQLTDIEYIPFLSFKGEVVATSPREVIFKHMNKPLGRLIPNGRGSSLGQVLVDGQWIEDDPTAQEAPHQTIETFSDFWGFRNFGMARLLTEREVQHYTDLPLEGMEGAPLYLEIRHTPSLTYPSPGFTHLRYGIDWFIPGYRTVIPLTEKQISSIMDHMYTSRFVVSKGRVKRYHVDYHHFNLNNPLFLDIPDGTYEFYHGVAYKIGIGGHATPLKKDHPLYQRSIERVQRLFNQGIEFDVAFDPHDIDQTTFPKRYVYFRDGALYLLGSPIIPANDPALTAFHQRENKRASLASPQKPYVPFCDFGPPYKNGKIDSTFIKTFGFKIPEGNYLVLGDNHAMSSDSRVFGLLPQENIQGAPSLIIWPLGERWGSPNQIKYPFLTTPRVIIWSIAGIVLLVIFIYHQRQKKQSIFPDDK